MATLSLKRVTELTHWSWDKMGANFKCFSLNENGWILIKISLKFVPKGPINNIPALVQIMAWRRPGAEPLSEAMMVSLSMHINGLVQDCSISIANALEILQSCTKPSIYESLRLNELTLLVLRQESCGKITSVSLLLMPWLFVSPAAMLFTP